MAETKTYHIARGTIALGIAFVVMFQLHHTTHVADEARLLQQHSDIAYAGRIVDSTSKKHGNVELDFSTGQLLAVLAEKSTAGVDELLDAHADEQDADAGETGKGGEVASKAEDSPPQPAENKQYDDASSPKDTLDSQAVDGTGQEEGASSASSNTSPQAVEEAVDSLSQTVVVAEHDEAASSSNTNEQLTEEVGHEDAASSSTANDSSSQAGHDAVDSPSQVVEGDGQVVEDAAHENNSSSSHEVDSPSQAVEGNAQEGPTSPGVGSLPQNITNDSHQEEVSSSNEVAAPSESIENNSQEEANSSNEAGTASQSTENGSQEEGAHASNEQSETSTQEEAVPPSSNEADAHTQATEIGDSSSNEVTTSRELSNETDSSQAEVLNQTAVSPENQTTTVEGESKSDGPSHQEQLDSAIQSANRNVVTKEALSRVVDASMPIKLTPSGQIDWDQYDHVYYYHTRKAGGTTLVKWVRLMAWKHGKNFTKDEGPVFDHEMFEGNDRVLLVTSLRPPTDRVLSSYNFDLNQVGVDMTIPEFVVNAHSYNTKKHTQFIKWENRKRGWIWKCASECYSKWFGGWPTPEFAPNAEKAAETLNNFEIIFMKNLKNEEYMNWLIHRFNDTNPIPHKRKTTKSKPKVTDDDMSLLDSVNRNDIELYNILREKWERLVPLNSTFI